MKLSNQDNMKAAISAQVLLRDKSPQEQADLLVEMSDAGKKQALVTQLMDELSVALEGKPTKLKRAICTEIIDRVHRSLQLRLAPH